MRMLAPARLRTSVAPDAGMFSGQLFTTYLARAGTYLALPVPAVAGGTIARQMVRPSSADLLVSREPGRQRLRQCDGRLICRLADHRPLPGFGAGVLANQAALGGFPQPKMGGSRLLLAGAGP